MRLPSLVVIATHRDGTERRAPLRMSPLVVGTAADCDLSIDDPSISRRHCAVTLTARGVLVRDLASKNGTSVGGVDVVEAFLSPSTVARIGGTTLRLQIVGPPSDVPLSPGASFGEALGGSIAMRALFAQLQAVAKTASAVLLCGATGTGKELLARAIHAESPWSEGPFVVLVDATPDASIAEASGGTLFVDELVDLAPDLQSLLLRALDAPGFRFIAATASDAKAAVARSELRQDLYYRIAAFEAFVPPLRERREDIELLTEHFLARGEPPRRLVDLPPGALAMLNGHDWPGNVRELKNAVARLVLFPHLGPAVLEYRGVSVASDGGVKSDAPSEVDRLLALPLRDARERVVERFEAHYLAQKLHEHGGNVSKMAAAVGLSRQMVHRLLARHGIGSRETS